MGKKLPSHRLPEKPKKASIDGIAIPVERT
jgi:hypothetical protein